MPHPPKVLYLHGFASGRGSKKARFFEAALRALNIPVSVLNLVPGDFESITISGQLQIIQQAAEGEPITLIGSSLGGYLASIFAARNPSVQRLLLLAPAFHFVELWRQRVGSDRWSRWQAGEPLPVFHYGLGRETNLSFDLMRDASQYPAEPVFTQPALLFHGLWDDVVPVSQSVDYARRQPNVRFTTMQSGHELTDVLDLIWQHSEEFLTGPKA